MAPLTINRRLDIPAFLQRLADLVLLQRLFLRQIFLRLFRLSVFRDELRRFHILRFPIEIEDLIFRAQEIFRMAMTFQTPRHAVRFGVIDDRHVIDLAVTTRAADPAIHMRRVIKENVVGRAMELHPLDRLSHHLEVPSKTLGRSSFHEDAEAAAECLADLLAGCIMQHRSASPDEPQGFDKVFG